MKGQLSVDPTFRSLNIKKPDIHLTHPLVAFDGHRMHFETKSILWQQKGIINCTYSRKWDVIMVLCSDWKLYIFNRNLDVIARLSDWQSKYSVGFEYIQQLSCFLLIGVIEIQMLKVVIHTNIKETKFLSSVKYSIQRKQLKSVEQKNRLSWNKGYGYDMQENLLYVWSTQNINFYSLNKLELQSNIVKLVKKQSAITYVHLNRTYKYTITGLINGNLKIWRVPLSPITSQTAQYIMIHNCIHHTKTVTKIVPASDHRLVLSSSEDLTLCLWSLETFELLRAYNFEGEYTELFLIDQKRAFALQNGFLGEIVFGKTMQFIMEIDSSICYFDKSLYNNSWRSFQITLQANVGIQVRTDQLKKKDLNKMEIGYFYPPLKAQSIRQIVPSPYQDNIYYMLVERGELFSLRFQENASKIQHSFAIHHALDTETHSLNQTPTYIAFLQLPDIIFDSEITEGTLSHRTAPVTSNESASKDLKLCTLGCNKGSIIIISLDQIQKIRTRLTYHRQSILSIQMIKGQHSGYTLASYCAQDYLRLILLQDGKAQCFFVVHCSGNLKFFRSFEDKLVMVFKKGIFQIATAMSDQNLQIMQNLDAVDHQGQILSIDTQPSHRFIMTAGNDNRIKIWSTFKTLVYQIKLDEGLKYAFWSNNLEIFVAHRNKLLYLRDFKINKQQDGQGGENSKNITIFQLKEYFVLLKKQNIKKKQLQDEQYQNTYETVKSRKKALSIIETKPIKIENNKSFLDTRQQFPKRKGSSNKVVRTDNKQMHRTKNKSSYTSNARAEEDFKRKLQFQSKLKATKKHMQEISTIKKMTNNNVLPKIVSKHEDKFQQFINAKLINKKMLTRRDITLNRIIMKNLIREQFSQQEEDLSNLKLDF